MQIRSTAVLGACLALAVALPRSAAAQATPPDPAANTPQTPPVTSNPDIRVDPLQPDFNLAALPTTLRLPEHKMAFRVTHRFTRSLGSGSFSDLVNDFFGFDSAGAI